jgi:hypothetical protein
MEWDKAKQHLETVLGYYKELIGQPGVNVFFGLAYLDTLMKRYLSGERTQELYDEMMESE